MLADHSSCTTLQLDVIWYLLCKHLLCNRHDTAVHVLAEQCCSVLQQMCSPCLLLRVLHLQICRDEYCAMDETTGKQILLSKEEKERIFLDSIQSFYYR
jgi:hypothetical protein